MSDQHNDNPVPFTDAVITAKGLTKRYGQASAVDAISFAIKKGDVFGLLGPNGAGKTTTILMMLGLTEISSGNVSVLGFDPAREPLRVKRRVGYLPILSASMIISDWDNRRVPGFNADREKSIAVSAREAQTTRPLLAAMERILWQEDKLVDQPLLTGDA